MNCCVPPGLRLADDGLTVIVVSVWFTVTLHAAGGRQPPAFVIVTVKVYAPALLNVAVVFFAALVPLTLKVGAGPRWAASWRPRCRSGSLPRRRPPPAPRDWWSSRHRARVGAGRRLLPSADSTR